MTKASYKQYDGTCSANANTVTAMTNVSVTTQFAVVIADPTNSLQINIGPTGAANLYQLPAGASYTIASGGEQVFVDLADWNVKSAQANAAYHIGYL